MLLKIQGNKPSIDIESKAALTQTKENEKGLRIVNNIGRNIFTENNELARESLENGNVDFFNPLVNAELSKQSLLKS